MANKISTITLEQKAELHVKINMVKSLTVDIYGLSNGLKNLTSDEIDAINNIASILEKVNNTEKSSPKNEDEFVAKTSVKDYYSVSDIVDLTKVVPGNTVTKSEKAEKVETEIEPKVKKKPGRKPGSKNKTTAKTTKKSTTAKTTETKAKVEDVKKDTKKDVKKDTKKESKEEIVSAMTTKKKPGRKPGSKNKTTAKTTKKTTKKK